VDCWPKLCSSLCLTDIPVSRVPPPPDEPGAPPNRLDLQRAAGSLSRIAPALGPLRARPQAHCCLFTPAAPTEESSIMQTSRKLRLSAVSET
jgi:hypothetical protein